MKEIRCFVTKNILEGRAKDYHLSFAFQGDSCVVIAMGDGPAEMSDFSWTRWDKLRMRLPDPHEILLIGNMGQWHRSRDSVRWVRVN